MPLTKGSEYISISFSGAVINIFQKEFPPLGVTQYEVAYKGEILSLNSDKVQAVISVISEYSERLQEHSSCRQGAKGWMDLKIICDPFIHPSSLGA